MFIIGAECQCTLTCGIALQEGVEGQAPRGWPDIPYGSEIKQSCLTSKQPAALSCLGPYQPWLQGAWTTVVQATGPLGHTLCRHLSLFQSPSCEHPHCTVLHRGPSMQSALCSTAKWSWRRELESGEPSCCCCSWSNGGPFAAWEPSGHKLSSEGAACGPWADSWITLN